MKRSLIQKPILSAPQRPAADFAPAVKDVVQCRALKAGRTGSAILGPRKPRSGKYFFHPAQKRLMNFPINHSALQAAKIMRSRHGQGDCQILPMKNHATSRPAADRRQRPHARTHTRIPLRVTERDGGSRPAVKTGDRASRQAEQRLVHGHLFRCRPRLVVHPNLQSGDHRFMDYHQRRRNPLLLLVADGIEWLG